MKPLLAVAALALTGCVVIEHTGPTLHDTLHVERDKAEMVKVDLRMGAGELKVSGGATKLVDGAYDYNVPESKPVVRYDNSGLRGYLSIEQPSTRTIHTGSTKYTWDLRFNDEVPLDMSVHLGAGEGRLDLGSLSLRSVEVNMGVGELRLDLRGEPKRDYDVHIRGGVGEARVYLPRNVGIYADATGGIGGIKTSGLRKEGGHWVNDAYDKSKVKVHLDVRGGVGEINLIGE